MNRDFKYPTYLGLLYLLIGGLTSYSAAMAYQFEDGTLVIKLFVIALSLYAAIVHFTASHVRTLSEGIHIKKNLISSPKTTKWQDISSLEVGGNKIEIKDKNGLSFLIYKTHIKGNDWPELLDIIEKSYRNK